MTRPAHMALGVGLPLLSLLLGDTILLVKVAPDRLQLGEMLDVCAYVVTQLVAWVAAAAILWGAVGLAAPAPQSSRARLLYATAVLICVAVIDAVLLEASFTRHWSLLPLRLAKYAVVLSVALVFVARPSYFGPSQSVYRIGLVLPSLSILVAVLLFGQSALPMTPKYLREPVAALVLHALQLHFTTVMLSFPSQSRREAQKAVAIGCSIFLLASVAASASSQSTRYLVETSLEGSRSVQTFNRTSIRLLGLPPIPGIQEQVGERRTPPVVVLPEEQVSCTRRRGATIDAVVIVSVDSLRADYFGLRPDELPSMASLRRRGLEFTRAMQAMSGTAGSIFAMHTGRYPVATTPTRDAWSVMSEDLGFAYSRSMQPWEDHKHAERYTDTLLEELRGHARTGRPFLVHAHYLALHMPAGFSRKDWNYSSALLAVDRELGRIMQYLQSSGLSERTALVFTADHGEELRHERGYVSHGYGVTQTLIHTPLILWSPTVAPGRSDALVSGVDILPTLLDMLGIACSYSMHGYSLLHPSAGLRERVVFASSMAPNAALGDSTPLLYSDIHAAIQWPWKVVFNRAANAWALYDLAADPMERTNLADSRRDIRRRMEAALDRYLGGQLPASAAGAR